MEYDINDIIKGGKIFLEYILNEMKNSLTLTREDVERMKKDGKTIKRFSEWKENYLNARKLYLEFINQEEIEKFDEVFEKIKSRIY